MSTPRHHLPLAPILVRQSGPRVSSAHRTQTHLVRSAEQRGHLAQPLAQNHRQRLLHRRVTAECERQAHHDRQAVDRRPGGAHLLDAQLGDPRLYQVSQTLCRPQRQEASLSRLWQGLLRQVQQQTQDNHVVVAHGHGARMRLVLPQGEHTRAQVALLVTE